MSHLDDLGLIQFSSVIEFRRERLPKTFTVYYCDQPLTLTMQKETDNDLSIGNVLLTQAGKELARISNAPGVDGFLEYVKEQWSAYLPENGNIPFTVN